LPEAMAGPGPVSALIHAATMVKSGVYLVARLIPIFYYGYWASGVGEASAFFTITAWVGVITAFVAATQGLVALELKKVLAFSTVSQIGYMWIGLGVAGLSPAALVSGTTSGIFHLVSHAVFKACLFLCAGSVIHAAHSIYMTEMGSMKKYMPLTWIFMLVAALSLMGLPPLPGFWSKDAILLSSLEAHAVSIFILAMITVVLTSFYTTRMVGMVFYGPDSPHLEQAKQQDGNPHEAHRTMWGACCALAVIIVFLGLVGPRVEHHLAAAFHSDLVQRLHLPVAHAANHSLNYHLIVPLLSVLSVLLGALPAYFLYIARKKDPRDVLNKYAFLKILRGFFWRRWFIDGLYYKVFLDGMLKIADFVAHTLEDGFDNLVHRKFPDLVTRRFHEVLLYLRTDSDVFFYNITYILIIFIGLLVAILW
ncbi:MAG: proton-conducting transporter membrane subunit, partial [Desulfobacterales bacterium]